MNLVESYESKTYAVYKDSVDNGKFLSSKIFLQEEFKRIRDEKSREKQI